MAHAADEDGKAHDHSEVLNGTRPDADRHLINDILNHQNSSDESDPGTPHGEVDITITPNPRAMGGRPTKSPAGNGRIRGGLE